MKMFSYEKKQIQSNIVTEIEDKILEITSDDEFQRKTEAEQEALVLRVLFFVEEYIKKSLASFRCGDFLIFNSQLNKVQNVVEYVKFLGANYEVESLQNKTRYGFFHKSYTKEHQEESGRAFEELFQEGLLFSNIVRGSIAEKNVLIVCIDLTKPLSGFKDGVIASIEKRRASNWFRVPQTLSFQELCRGNDDVAKAEFKKLKDVIVFHEAANFDVNKLRRYVAHIVRYVPMETDALVMVYCPAIFMSEEPPANFWGLFSGEDLLRSDYEIEKFLNEIENIQSCMNLIMSQVIAIQAKKRAAEFATTQVATSLSHALKKPVNLIRFWLMKYAMDERILPLAIKKLDEVKNIVTLFDVIRDKKRIHPAENTIASLLEMLETTVRETLEYAKLSKADILDPAACLERIANNDVRIPVVNHIQDAQKKIFFSPIVLQLLFDENILNMYRHTVIQGVENQNLQNCFRIEVGETVNKAVEIGFINRDSINNIEENRTNWEAAKWAQLRDKDSRIAQGMYLNNQLCKAVGWEFIYHADFERQESHFVIRLNLKSNLAK